MEKFTHPPIDYVNVFLQKCKINLPHKCVLVSKLVSALVLLLYYTFCFIHERVLIRIYATNKDNIV